MPSAADLARRLEQALAMWDDGVELMRETLRRRMPDAAEVERAAALAAWLRGDDPSGVDLAPGQWPRRSSGRPR